MAEVKNEKGQTLAEFLAVYDPRIYQRPSVTVDVALLTDEGEVLLIRRADHPNIGRWALPGGFIEMDETLYESAARELREETGLKDILLYSLGVFGEVSRDPRTRVITAAFWAQAARDLLNVRAGDDAADARLFTHEVRILGEIGIPSRQHRAPDTGFPCTPCGVPLPEKAAGYALTLRQGDTRISAKLALGEGKSPILLGGTVNEGDEQLASDHALILFCALLASGKGI